MSNSISSQVTSSRIMKERIDDFFVWSEPNASTESIFLCAIDRLSLADDEIKKSFWCSLMNNIDKLPDLKAEMVCFIESDIEAGNDSWA